MSASDHKAVIRLNPDGSLDEIVASVCHLHLEQMGANHWWLGITTEEGMVHVNLCSRSKITADLDDERGTAT